MAVEYIIKVNRLCLKLICNNLNIYIANKDDFNINQIILILNYIVYVFVLFAAKWWFAQLNSKKLKYSNMYYDLPPLHAHVIKTVQNVDAQPIS